MKSECENESNKIEKAFFPAAECVKGLRKRLLNAQRKCFVSNQTARQRGTHNNNNNSKRQSMVTHITYTQRAIETIKKTLPDAIKAEASPTPTPSHAQRHLLGHIENENMAKRQNKNSS